MRYLAVFLLGLIMGAGLIHLLTARQQEQLYLAYAELEQRLVAVNEELFQLKKNLDQESRLSVVAIEPVITFSGNRPPSVEGRAVTQALSEEIQNILAPLKGEDVRRLNPALIPAMIDGRIVKVNGRQFKLQVTLLLISDKIIVHVQAQGLPASLSSSAGPIFILASIPPILPLSAALKDPQPSFLIFSKSPSSAATSSFRARILGSTFFLPMNTSPAV